MPLGKGTYTVNTAYKKLKKRKKKKKKGYQTDAVYEPGTSGGGE